MIMYDNNSLFNTLSSLVRGISLTYHIIFVYGVVSMQITLIDTLS